MTTEPSTRTPLGVFLEFLVGHFGVAVWAGHHLDQSAEQPGNHQKNDDVAQHHARSPNSILPQTTIPCTRDLFVH